jgi:hypothetical protein
MLPWDYNLSIVSVFLKSYQFILDFLSYLKILTDDGFGFMANAKFLFLEFENRLTYHKVVCMYRLAL